MARTKKSENLTQTSPIMPNTQRSTRSTYPIGEVAILYNEGYSLRKISSKLNISRNQARDWVMLASSIIYDPFYKQNIYTRGRKAGQVAPALPRQSVNFPSLLTDTDDFVPYVEALLELHKRVNLGHQLFTTQAPVKNSKGRWHIPSIVPKEKVKMLPWRGLSLEDLCTIMHLVFYTDGYIKSYRHLNELLNVAQGKSYSNFQIRNCCKILHIVHKQIDFTNAAKAGPRAQEKLKNFLDNTELETFSLPDIWFIDEISFSLEGNNIDVLFPFGSEQPQVYILKSVERPKGSSKTQREESGDEVEETEPEIGSRRNSPQLGPNTKRVQLCRGQDVESKTLNRSNRSDESESVPQESVEVDDDSSESFIPLCGDISQSDQSDISDVGTWTVTAAMNAKQGGCYMLTKGPSSSEIFVQFLEFLRAKILHDRQIYVVYDNSPIHCTPLVWEAIQVNNIKAHLRPSNYPELNAIDMVFCQWKDNFKQRPKKEKITMRDDIVHAIADTKINTKALYDHTIGVIHYYRQRLNK